jgi:hypothetical protein
MFRHMRSKPPTTHTLLLNAGLLNAGLLKANRLRMTGSEDGFGQMAQLKDQR